MRRVLLIAVVVAAVIVGWLLWKQRQVPPLIVSGFIEADSIRVGSRVGGRVAKVRVSEGQTVRAGEPLFELDPFDLKATLLEAEAQLAGYQAEHNRLKAGFRVEEIEQGKAKRDRAAAILQKLQSGPRPLEIQIAREKLNMARANMDLAESEHARLMRLYKEQQAAQTEIDRAVQGLKSSRAAADAARFELALLEEGSRKEDIAEARAALGDAEAGLNLMQRGYRTEDVAKAAAQVAAAEARVAAIQMRLGELVVAAPCDCVVEAIDLRPGDLVGMNAPAVSVLDLSRLWVRVYLPEAKLGHIRLEQRVTVRAPGYPNERFGAHISFISQEAEFTPRNVQTPEERSKQAFRIKVTLDEGKDRLRAGMTADVNLEEPGGS